MEFDRQGERFAVRLEVRPLGKQNGKQNLLVVFQKLEEAAGPEPRKGTKAGRASGKRNPKQLEKLERELGSTREHLRTLIAEQESAQEEMKVANEEILSSNEELQSTNEELETAKEELQSSNEELITLNNELQHHNADLAVLTHDLNNLLVGLDIPLLLLDSELRVRRFTPVAGALFNLIPADVGRPFSNIASNLDVADWPGLFAEVTVRGRSLEREVSDRSGHRYSLRVGPYKTGEDRIEGVLLVMLDMDIVYRARDEAQRSGDYARAIVETVREALVVVDSEWRVLTANRSFCGLFGVTLPKVEGRDLFSVGDVSWDARGLRELLRDILPESAHVEDFAFQQDFPEIGRRHLLLNARQIDPTQTILIAIEDVTDQRQAQEASEKSQATIRALLESTTQSIIAVDEQQKIVLVNGNSEQMFGYTHEELIGQPLELLIPEASRGRHRAHHASYFADMQNRPMGIGLKLTARRKDRAEFPVEISLGAIDTPEGKRGVAFVSDITQRSNLEQAARVHAQEIQALAASLLTAQEEERRRVSRELHDQICQQLASLAIDIGSVVADVPLAEDARVRLRALQARAVKASEETRHIAYELHPSILDDLGLVASLQSLCRDFSEHYPEMTLEFTDGELPGPVSRTIGSCLYRVLQASLRNVAEHAQAHHISAALSLRNGTLSLTIADDGVGFDPRSIKERSGLGLIGMEERVRLVHGKLTIDAQPGHGTRIAVAVPFPGSSV